MPKDKVNRTMGAEKQEKLPNFQSSHYLCVGELWVVVTEMYLGRSVAVFRFVWRFLGAEMGVLEEKCGWVGGWVM